MPLSHCLSLYDFTATQMQKILDLAVHMKTNPADYKQSLAGKSIAMLFEKPSLRTRVSFDVGIHQLGGHAIYLDSKQVGPGARETVTDIANNLACWTDAIVARVYDHATLVALSQSKVPVINALCDLHHPCQTLADLLTLQTHFGSDLSAVKLAYLGDGNNVCHSLMVGAAALGMPLQVFTPKEDAISSACMARLNSQFPQHQVNCLHDLSQLGPVDAVYTDTWVSMGEDPTQSAAKKQRLTPFQVNQQLVADTQASVVMHCLPAHRGEEISDAVLDGPCSVVLEQAENRMHAQKALLHSLFHQII
jgi:ornithine carbamoyltransferase